MKTTETLSKLSNEALIKKLKKAKAHFIGFMMFFALLVIGCNYFTITIGFGYHKLIPVAFLPVIIANIFSYGKIKQEAKIRRLL